ncbi:hypothetical protein ACIBG8_19540 [Nonomuraea sp. NPDC050556]|uniref:hypothetical protein n=1 Tax=Nonomuraea sp. NPDC050556 TaxID=3364369 RepID=UPI00378B5F2D
MANKKMEDDELRLMFEAKTPYRDIARRYNTTVAGVQSAAERLGFQRKNLRHDKFIPWDEIAVEHRQSGPITSLRNLSKVSQGQAIPITKLNSALRWAVGLEENNLDIDYDPERGFFEKPAGEPWHIKMVLEDVREVIED